MSNHPFFGVILHDLKFVFATNIESFSTDGETIFFNPYYLKDLSEYEVDVCILHVLIHISLKHHLRYPNAVSNGVLQQACDIVANSNLMVSLDNNMQEIMVQGRVLPHRSLSGVEGYKLTVEDVYNELMKKVRYKDSSSSRRPEDDDEEFVRIDSFTAGSVPIPKTKLFQVNADISKKIYLKQCYYLDYSPIDRELAWTLDDHQPSFDTNKFVYDNIVSYPKHKKVNITITLPERMKGQDTPCPNYSKDQSRFGTTIQGAETINGECLYFVLNREAFAHFLLNKNKGDKAYEKELKDYLGLPDNVKTHFDTLNQKLKWKYNYDLLFKIRDYCATTFEYDLKYPKAPIGYPDPIIYFAEFSKKGKCTHFATYTALMYRYFGIPSRVVGGYLVDACKSEDVDVYAENSHAWVEVYIQNLGWVSVDPTPVIATLNAGNGDSKLDSHRDWGKQSQKDSSLREDQLNKKLHEAYKTSKDVSAGKIPSSIESEILDLSKTKINWRILIDNFVQDDICDYTLVPPDNRYSNSEFFLPSFSERDEKVKKILLMVDVSGSMSDEQISECFNEINGLIIQFNMKVEGYVGFFDYSVKQISPFDQDTDILAIKPYGRGGTSFHSVFSTIQRDMKDDLPSKIIILTDGFANFPDEEEALGVPVLWIINNEEVTPPWGTVARLI